MLDSIHNRGYKLRSWIQFGFRLEKVRFVLRVSPFDQMDTLVSRVAQGALDLKPLEYLGRFTLVEHQLLGVPLGRGRVKPLLG